jgi:hypothetical protein
MPPARARCIDQLPGGPQAAPLTGG